MVNWRKLLQFTALEYANSADGQEAEPGTAPETKQIHSCPRVMQCYGIDLRGWTKTRIAASGLQRLERRRLDLEVHQTADSEKTLRV